MKYILLLTFLCYFNIIAFAKTTIKENYQAYSTIDLNHSLEEFDERIIDQSSSTKSNVEFKVSNDGIFGQDTAKKAGLQWPRGSQNNYIFGGGLWFGAQKKVNGSLNKLCIVSYNPNSGATWFQPSAFTSTSDSSSIQQTRVFRSTDFNSDGIPIQSGFSSNWLIWDTDPFSILYADGYIGKIVTNPQKRNKAANPKGAVVISDEDFVTVFDDQNIEKYEGGVENRKRQGYPLNIQVTQRVFSWSSEELKDAIIIEQEITNTGKDTLFKCVFAPVYDSEIGAVDMQKTSRNDNYRYLKEDSLLSLGVMWTEASAYEAGRGFGYMTIGFIRTPTIDEQGYLLSNNDQNDRSKQLGVNMMRSKSINSDGDEPEKYDYITDSLIETIQRVPDDYRFFMSTYGFNLRPNESAIITHIICFAKPSVKPEADGSPEDVQGVVNLFKKTRTFYDTTFNKKHTINQPSKDDLSAFPNPASDNLFVRLPLDYLDSKVTLRTLLGCEVSSIVPITGGASIDVSSIAAGVYYLFVESKSGTKVTIPVAVIH